MAKKQAKVPIYFISAFTPREGVIGIAAYPDELEGTDEEFTRFLTLADGTWLHLDLDFDVSAVGYEDVPGARAWWLVNKRGEMVRISKQGTQRTVIAQAGTGPKKRGYLTAFANVAGTLFVCGAQRQLYRLTASGQWLDVAGSALADGSKEAIIMNAVDGSSVESVYLAGNNGEIGFYNGNVLQLVSSPTNVHLNDVCCVSGDDVLLCGYKGVVLRGSKNGWQVISDSSITDTLWAIDYFKGKIFVSATSGLFELRDEQLTHVRLGKDEYAAYRLVSNDRELWSVGERHIWKTLDGVTWSKVKFSDNEP